jgi:hypothetical protein
MERSKVKSFIAAVLLAASAAPALSAECTIDQVTFVQPEAEGFTLTFRPAAEPNAYSNLEATLKTPTREFKFSMTASNGYSFNYLVPSWPDAPDDPSFHIFLYDKNFATLGLPNKGVAVPEAILTPELGSWLWYGGDVDTPREFLPADMWRAEGCS